MSMDLRGQVALVTGSGRGLGRAIAARLGQLGAAVAVHDITADAPAEFKEARDIHDVAQGLRAYDEARQITGRPTVIIARTVKGKGVSFMELKTEWHGVAPTREQLEQALQELKD